MNILFNTLKEKVKANPAGLYVLFYTQMWELFGRFSITALLVLYLTKNFHLTDANAFVVYSTFIALIFASPIAGGFLSDRYLGSKHAILLGACIMVVGNALLVIPDKEIVFLGLATVAVGCGFFLPSIPPLVSAIYEHDNARRDAGFTIYYLGTNLGALLGPILCGFVGQHYGFNYAFLLSTFGMLSGIVVFICGQKHLHQFKRPPKILAKKKMTLPIIYLGTGLVIPVFMLVIQKDMAGFLLSVIGVIVAVILYFIFLRANNRERRQLIVILISIFAVIIFEAFLGQGGTTLNLFIDREVNRHFLGLLLPTSFFYALDPIFMLMLGPVLAMVWTRLARKNKEPIVTTKFALALCFLAIGFLIFVLAAIEAKIYGSASLFFVVLAYFLFPAAELCIVPISLSLVTRLAPKGLEAILVGIWMLSSATSGYLTGFISKFGQVNFSVSNISGLKQAAVIYQHMFMGTAGVLFLAGIVMFLLGALVKHLLREEAKQTV